MRSLHFQPFSGASGDMMLGALVDLGVSLEALGEGLSSLGIQGWRLEEDKVRRGPFAATRVRVLVSEPEAGQHHRHLEDILGLVDRSSLPAPVKAAAASAFRKLADAEARVHGIPVERVHFHEVGAVDSIVDVVGTCLGIHLLGAEEVTSGRVAVGTGFVDVAHGKLPLPAPATLEILRGAPVEQRDSGAELTTPTGAALLATLARRFGTFPPMVVTRIGYGAGDDRAGSVPNVLRAILGERPAGPGDGGARAVSGDWVVVLETSIDDMSPQWFGHLFDRLFEAGALDVTVTPVTMKKSRPAQELRVLVSPEKEGGVLAEIFRQSTTFGVRRQEVERIVLERETVEVETPWGTVRVKAGRLGPDIVTASPEYEDVRAAAARGGIPLKEVHERVLTLFRGRGGHLPGGPARGGEGVRRGAEGAAS